jgi:hypothetical protein
MRHVALEKGFTMNEHGLYIMKDKKKGEKVKHHFTSEEDIFNFLGLVYKAPNERTDGRAIVFKKQEQEKEPLPSHIEKAPIQLVLEEEKVMPAKKPKKTLNFIY